MDAGAVAGVALDGIVGAVVGGIAAGMIARWSVRKTIEHERLTQQRTEMRAAVNRLHIAAYRTAMDPPTAPEGYMDWWRTLYWNVLETEAAVAALDEQLRRDLDDLSILMRELLPSMALHPDLTHQPGSETGDEGAIKQELFILARQVHNLATEVAANSYKWLRNPEEFAELPRPLWNALRARALAAQVAAAEGDVK